MGVTFRIMLRKPVTREYPNLKKAVPDRARGYPLLTWDEEHGDAFCIGCKQCDRACPVECITVDGPVDNPKYKTPNHDTTCEIFLRDGLCVLHTSPRKTTASQFFIDEYRCMRCNICVEVCPTDRQFGQKAIVLDNTWLSWESSHYDRNDLVLDMDQLLAPSKAGILKPLDPTTVTADPSRISAKEMRLGIPLKIRVKSMALRFWTKMSPRWRKRLKETKIPI